MPTPQSSLKRQAASPTTQRNKKSSTNSQEDGGNSPDVDDDTPIFDTNYSKVERPGTARSKSTGKKNTLKRFKVVLDSALQISYNELGMRYATELGSGAFGVVFKV